MRRLWNWIKNLWRNIMSEKVKNPGGSIYDVYLEGEDRIKQGRMPELGDVVEYDDGRKFIFCSTTQNVAAGRLVGSQEPTDAALTASALAGSQVLEFQAVATTVNMFADGFIVLDEGNPKTTYKIQSNTASTGGGNLVRVTLYKGLVAPVLDGQVITLVPNRVSRVVINTATTDAVGSALVTVAPATVAYFWAQYQGVGATSSTGLAVGDAAMATAAGALLTATEGKFVVAKCLYAGSEVDTVYWSIPSW